MNTEFQIFRWGIPGWVFIMTYTLFDLAIYKFDTVLFLKNLGNNPAGIAALFAGLGIPLGYIIYQVYFWFKWTFGNKQAYVAMENIDYLIKNKKCNVREDWAMIEEYFDHLMTVVAIKKTLSYEDLKRRVDHYSNRTSRTHGLGASLLAMGMGFLLFVAVNGISTMTLNYFGGLAILHFLVGIAIYSNYVAQNKSTYHQINSIMIDILQSENKH